MYLVGWAVIATCILRSTTDNRCAAGWIVSIYHNTPYRTWGMYAVQNFSDRKLKANEVKEGKFLRSVQICAEKRKTNVSCFVYISRKVN